MSAKSFSTRLDPELVDQVKFLSQSQSKSVQDVVTELLKLGLSKYKDLDPWAEFAGSADLGKGFEKMIKEKRQRYTKSRSKRKKKLASDD
jgi:hypothetical protein